MKKLTCEMCGSTDLLKDGGVFVCQNCGTKYSVEEAKKMMRGEGAADAAEENETNVKKTAKSSSKLKNLYEIARRARDTGDSEATIKYYDQILTREPTSWEAYFFTALFRAIKAAEQDIVVGADSLINCMDNIIQLSKDHVAGEDEEISPIVEIYSRVTLWATMLNNNVTENYNALDDSVKDECMQTYINCANAAARIDYALGESIEQFYSNDPAVMILAAGAWKCAIDIHNSYLACLENKDMNIELMNEYITKIKAIDSSYEAPEFKTSNGGCYIATAVYGSYDCPEVWTLRRFRDYTLANTWYGRAFIRTYYAISPTMVKWFGKSQWFKNMFLPLLNKLVNKLHNEGVEDTPYNDKVW